MIFSSVVLILIYSPFYIAIERYGSDLQACVDENSTRIGEPMPVTAWDDMGGTSPIPKIIWVIRFALIFLFLVSPALAQTQQPPTAVEQRLVSTVGSLVLENTRLAVALDEANKTIEQLRAELDRVQKPTSETDKP